MSTSYLCVHGVDIKYRGCAMGCIRNMAGKEVVWEGDDPEVLRKAEGVAMKAITRSEFESIDMLAREINVWADQTFPDRSPDSSLFKLVMEEVPELLQHKKQLGLDEIDGELADCFILLLDLAIIWGIPSIAAAIRKKMAVNRKRSWLKDESSGFYNHVEPFKDYGITALESEGGHHD